jgi:DUF438 domain-containing protein
MNIQAEKLEIMKMILETDNQGILNSVKKIFEKELNVDFWEIIPSAQKDDILKGIEDIENGEMVDYDDFINKFEPMSYS